MADDKDAELTKEQKKATDLLYEAMLFWQSEGIRLIKRIEFILDSNGDGRLALQLAKTWKDVDDRWIECARLLAPYQSSKLANTAAVKKEIKRFVIEAPRVIADKHEWLDAVASDQAKLPKPNIVMNGNSLEHIDENIEDVNEY